LRLDADPVAVAVSPNGKTAYVVGAANDESGAPGSLTAVNMSTRTVNMSAKVPDPMAVAVPGTGNTVYVLNGFMADVQPAGTPGTLTPVNTATGVEGKAAKVASGSTALVITPDGKVVYALGGSAVTPVITASSAAWAPIKIRATAAAVTPNGKEAYFLVPTALSVVPVDTATQAMSKPIGTGLLLPAAVAASPNGQSIYVVATPDPGLGGGSVDKLLVISASTNNVTRTVTLGSYPKALDWAVAVTPNGKAAYALGWGTRGVPGVVLPFDTATGAVGKPIATGLNSSTIAVSANGLWAYVLDSGVPPGSSGPLSAGSVIPIDVATEKASKAIPVPAYAEAMATS
jgi:hypothetical protein